MADSQTARIPASVETRDRLKARKNGGETYDDVLQRLLGDGDSSFSATAEITPTLDEDALEELRQELSDVSVDAEAIASIVAERMDYAAVAGMTADEVVERLRSEMG